MESEMRVFGVVDYPYFTGNIVFKFPHETRAGNLVTEEMRPQIEAVMSRPLSTMAT